MLRFRKQFVAILLVLSLIVSGASMAMAALEDGQKNAAKKGAVFSVKGEVIAIDATAMTMTVSIDKASRLLKGSVGQEFTFDISDNVRVRLEGTEPGEFDLTLDDVEVGGIIRALGKKVGDSYEIRQIVVF